MVRSEALVFGGAMTSFPFTYRVVAHADRVSNCTEARMTLEGLPVLAVHQIGIDKNFARAKSQAKDTFRHRKITAGFVPIVVIIFQ